MRSLLLLATAIGLQVAMAFDSGHPRMASDKRTARYGGYPEGPHRPPYPPDRDPPYTSNDPPGTAIETFTTTTTTTATETTTITKSTTTTKTTTTTITSAAEPTMTGIPTIIVPTATATATAATATPSQCAGLPPFGTGCQDAGVCCEGEDPTTYCCSGMCAATEYGLQCTDPNASASTTTTATAA